ncbi:hypothetical protein [Haliscomenobacter sp.]|uniref:hypothetical protein n=1 Tax=Haliscomenobacter sp. TaxID=2717303 RepID=UPI00359459F5
MNTKIFLSLSFITAAILTLSAQKPIGTTINRALLQNVKINRWVSPVYGDWESIPANHVSDAVLLQNGYKTKTFQFEAYAVRPSGNNVIAVNRWTLPGCNTSILLGEHEHTDAQLQSWGYRDKKFQFYAYRTRPATGKFLEVSRWVNALPQGNPCRDYTLCLVEGEHTDQNLLNWGYSSKKVMFYVPDHRQPASNITTINILPFEEWLCPKALLRGDREFDGHGPRIKCEVKLSIGDAGRSLYADIYLWAQETVHDWSTTEQKWRKKVYDAPYGKTIATINSATASRTQFISPPGGFQFIAPGADISNAVASFLGSGVTVAGDVFASFGIPVGDYRSFAQLVKGVSVGGNTICQVPPTEGTLVRFFHIVGDTGGPDISEDDNCNDDTRIVKLEFNPVKLTFR